MNPNDVNERDRMGRIELHYAVGVEKNIEKAAALISAGADIEARDHKGLTPLHIAAQHRRGEAIVRFLLDAGADPNAPDNRGRGPLMIAVASSHNPAIEEMLLKAGADPYQHGPGEYEYWPAKSIAEFGTAEERRVFEPYLRR